MISALLWIALLGAAFSGLPGYLSPRRGRSWAPPLMTIAALSAFVAAALVWKAGSAIGVALPWAGSGLMRCDGLSAWFLVPVFGLPALSAWYGQAYWDEGRHPRSARRIRLWLGILTASMGLVVLSNHAVVFLTGWELTALASWVLINGDENSEETRRAGWLYLAAAHVGTLSLLAGFCLLAGPEMNLGFDAFPARLADPSLVVPVFCLLTAAFGIKAGVIPGHIWLPSAHSAAPSHISAVMSGVVIKIGIYGIFRMLQWVPQPPLWWSGVFLALGSLSGIWGVALALGQHDLKRLLAYHSVENIGIILLGVSVAAAGLSLHQTPLVVLGLSGALLHTWNHALFKSLLFLSAGAVVRACGTREMDRLGGVGKLMPMTALAFTLGAMAICGLPPLNGFISEIFVYLGAFEGMSVWPWAGVVVVSMAIIGALALACFTKVVGAVFLGHPRTDRAEPVREAPVSMLWPMAVLAGGCILIGLAPSLVAPILHGCQVSIAPVVLLAPSIGAWPGFPAITALAALALLLLIPMLWLLRRTPRRASVTWDCGYARVSPRIQYTAVSFADGLIRNLRWFLQPQRHRPQIEGIFPQKSRGLVHVTDLFMEKVLTPLAHAGIWASGRMRFLQPGRIQLYLIYMAAALVVSLAWASLHD
jgi:hydrogenase-4 component B